jgi:type I restriction enzyme S subunit
MIENHTKIKKTPKLRFPEFHDEWQSSYIGKLSSKVGSGSTPRGGSATYKDRGVPFIRSQNVRDGKLDMSEVVFIDQATHASMPSTAIEPNDILLNITGASLGRTCVVPQDFIEGNLSQHVCIIRLKRGTSPYIVHTLISLPKGLHELLKTQTGGGKEGLNFQAVRSFKVILPSSIEQTKIAEFLMAVDEKVAMLQKKVDLQKKYKKGVMQAICTQKIRFKDKNGKDYPDWQEKKLSEISYIKAGNSKSAHIKEDGNNVIVDMGAISSNGSLIDTKRTDYSGDFILSSELVMVKDDIGAGKIIGKVVCIPRDNKYVLGDHVYKITPFEGVTKYLYYVINSESINRNFRIKANGTAQIGINSDTVHNQQLYLPSQKEQQKIANFLTALDDKIKLEESKLEQAKQLKEALLQQMFV